MRDHAHTLSNFRFPTLSIECEPCGRRGRYNIARELPEGAIVQHPRPVQGQVRRGQPALMIARWGVL
jgi:hypothetical protein